MKRISILLTIFMFSSGNFSNADVLKWDPPTPDQCVDGSNIYYSDQTTDEVKVVNVGNVFLYNIDQLDLDSCKLYKFHVKFYNAAGESEPSNIVDYVKVYTPPNKPQNASVERTE